ncbi:hypothetical protein CEXT_98281 [Caerostris extrusa]|uniref:Uncharacterized protein n=1 Tax=Caerostris extrusa TaxID=172846 RepID=A0AAV4PF70_CAEEX|nr:hypothetical protein CEXT_98281 [Caerostris extrusa]
MINAKFTWNATEEYKQARRNEKRLHKSKKKFHKENLLEEVERLKSSNESRAFYRATPSQVITEAPAEEYEEEDLIKTPTIDELQDIIDKLKNHKAAGPDEISQN